MRPKAIDVKPLENYILLIKFDNGEEKEFNVKPYLEHKAFLELKNKELFKTVKIGGLSIEWANVCPRLSILLSPLSNSSLSTTSLLYLVHFPIISAKRLPSNPTAAVPYVSPSLGAMAEKYPTALR